MEPKVNISMETDNDNEASHDQIVDTSNDRGRAEQPGIQLYPVDIGFGKKSRDGSSSGERLGSKRDG